MRSFLLLTVLICTLTLSAPRFSVLSAKADGGSATTNPPAVPPKAPAGELKNLSSSNAVTHTQSPKPPPAPPSPALRFGSAPAIGTPIGPTSPPPTSASAATPTPPLPPPAAAPVPPQAEAETDQSEEPAAPVVRPPPAARKQTVGVIDFQGTPVQAVLEYYATQLAKRSIIAAPNLSGTVYFRSQTDLTVEEAMQAIESVLAINGIAVVPMGEKFLKVVQIAAAKQEGIPFTGAGHEMPAADILSTQIIPMQYAEVADVLPAVQPYMHPYGQLLALTKSNAILITETAANVNQMLEIIKAVDVPSALRMETKIYILSHAKAADVMQRLQSIIQEAQQMGAGGNSQPSPVNVPTPIRFPRPTGQGGGQPGAGATGSSELVEGKVIMTADERTNKLFILARASNFAFFDKIIGELDAKVEPDVIMKVISLNYATAEDAASLVNALISGGSVSSSSSSRKTSSSSKSSSSTTRTSGTPAPPPPPPVAVQTRRQNPPHRQPFQTGARDSIRRRNRR